MDGIKKFDMPNERQCSRLITSRFSNLGPIFVIFIRVYLNQYFFD